MENKLFTDTQKPEDPVNLKNDILIAIRDLQNAFPKQKIDALYWNKDYTAIPIELKIELPTRGPVGGIDIRKVEPVILLFHKVYYPYKAPSAWSNRPDFPASQLPHLNPTKPGRPANFCLHRGSIDNWFAEHSLLDFIDRICGWLRDAARDRLIRKKDGFEPIRLNDTTGYAIYEQNLLKNHIYSNWREKSAKGGFSFLLYQLLKNTEKEPLLSKNTYALRLISILDEKKIEPTLAFAYKYNSLYTPENSLERLLFGVLAWTSKKNINKDFFASIPENLLEFQDFIENLGVPVKKALNSYLKHNLQILAGVPLTVVLKRPQRIIRTRSTLELINFVILAGGEHWPKNGEWDLSAEVSFLGHRTPLTPHWAREISSFPTNIDLGSLLFLGCGAVGSKLILHLAKSGQTKMTLVDFDNLSPHNLVRHALTKHSLGKNKAEALKETIEGIYYADKSVKINTIKESALNIFLTDKKDILKDYKWIIDATASSMMLNISSQIELPSTTRFCRCEIGDNGRIGILSVEGLNRNPRVDDLQISLFDMSIENLIISKWLIDNQSQREREVGSVLEDINIGISCSSETMRISDETVSLHTASFANGFRKYTINQSNIGRLQLSHLNIESNLTTIVQQFEIYPWTIVNSRNDPTWQIRLNNGLDKKLKLLLRHSKPNETGGLLIGMINFKRKIIYVSRALKAPPDSKSSPYAFVRGIQDVPEKVFEIQKRTGGILGYVGEWHTHPFGGPELSPIDKNAIEKIKNNLDKIPLPTHILIVTSRGLYPHIFSPIK